MIDPFNKKANPQLTSVETNLTSLRHYWRKYFAFEYNQVRCINKFMGDGKVIEVGEEISKTLILHQRKNYNSFTLSLINCEILTEKSINPFLHDLLPGIKDVAEFKLRLLNFDEPKQSKDNCLKMFFQGTLRNLTKLESLTLDFHGTWNLIDDKMFAFLAKEIGKNQDKLKHLKIDLSHCRSYSSRALEAIGREVGRRLCKLQSFTLNVGVGGQIDNEALKVLCYGIAKYQIKLKKLSLDVSQSNTMDDEGLKLIVNAITKRFDQLEWLYLNFSKCSNITNSGLELLSQKIATSLPKLQYFRLGFQQCEKTTPKIRDILRQNLRHIPQISYIF